MFEHVSSGYVPWRSTAQVCCFPEHAYFTCGWVMVTVYAAVPSLAETS
eukprot:COSAG03_NODE_18460_length_354_cov_1.160784_1_plen_47_part_10